MTQYSGFNALRFLRILLSAALIGALAVPPPAFALRQTSVHQNTGLEEEIRRALQPITTGGLEEPPAEGSPEGDGRRAGEVVYHLHVVRTDPNIDRVIEAIHAIGRLVGKGTPLEQDVLRVSLDRLAREPRPMAQGQLLASLVVVFYHRSEVWERLFSLMSDWQAHEGVFETQLLWKASLRLDGAPRAPSTVTRFVELLLSLLSDGAPEALQRQVLRIVQVWLDPRLSPIAGIAEDLRQDERWIHRLRLLAASHHRGIAARAIDVLQLLDVELDATPLTFDAARAALDDGLRALVGGTSQRSVTSTLSAGEMMQLGAQLRRSPSPDGLLQTLFENGAQAVFVNADVEQLPTAAATIQDAVSLADAGWLTHLAIPLRPSDEGALWRFLDGQNDPGFLQRLSQALGWRFLLSVDEDRARIGLLKEGFREAIRQLRARGVRFVLFAGETGVFGELAFEREVARLYEPFARGSAARMLVYGALGREGPAYGRVDLHGTPLIGEAVLRSYPVELAQRLGGAGKIVSVVEQDTARWEIAAFAYGIHNLYDFLTEHPIARDVGLRIAESALVPLRFSEDHDERYGEAWDALILRVAGDGGDGGAVEEPSPEPAEGEKAPPPGLVSQGAGPSSALLLLAPSAFERLSGLEEVVQALQQTGVGLRLIVLTETMTPEAVRDAVGPIREQGGRVTIVAGPRDPIASVAAQALRPGPTEHSIEIQFIPPAALEPWVAQIRDNLGTLSAVGLEDAGQEFLDAVRGLGAAS